MKFANIEARDGLCNMFNVLLAELSANSKWRLRTGARCSTAELQFTRLIFYPRRNCQLTPQSTVSFVQHFDDKNPPSKFSLPNE